MRWAGQVARTEERIVEYGVLLGKPEGKRPLVRHGQRWGIILKWILRKYDGPWTGLIWLRIGTDGKLL
jgi:hypothetical protein